MKFGRWATWFDMSRELKTGLYKLSFSDNFQSDGKKVIWVPITSSTTPCANITADNGNYYTPVGDLLFLSLHFNATLSGSVGQSIVFTGFPYKVANYSCLTGYVSCTSDGAGITRTGMACLTPVLPGSVLVYRSDFTNFPNSGELVVHIDGVMKGFDKYNG